MECKKGVGWILGVIRMYYLSVNSPGNGSSMTYIRNKIVRIIPWKFLRMFGRIHKHMSRKNSPPIYLNESYFRMSLGLSSLLNK
jgi:hypothetical protein